MAGRNKDSNQPIKLRVPLYVGIIFLMLAVAAIGGYLLGGMTTPAAQISVPIAPTEPDVETVSSDLELAEATMKKAVDVNVIYNNVYVNGINLSGKSEEEAYAIILNKLKAESPQTVTIVCEELRIPLSFDAEIAKEAARAAGEAYAYARYGTMEERYALILALEEKPHKITLSAIPDENQILAALHNIAPLVNMQAKNATIARVNSEFTFTKESAGRELDIPKTLEAVQIAYKEGKIETGAAVTIIEPLLTMSKVSKATSLLGTFSTTFTAGAVNRNTNIKVAAAFINDIVVNPGEIFSTNEHFKESTYENGYRMAGTIVDGELVDSLGGGICQVSSTLYNALLFSELQIVERRNHSLKVGYTDWGFDATLSGTVIDLKFKNNTECPVTIETFVTQDTVTVNIYGFETRAANRILKFENALIESIPPGPDIIKEDPNRPLGERFVKKPARTGYTYQVYKLVYVDDKLVEKVNINTSKYRSNAAEIWVGTGPAASEPPSEQGSEAPVVTIPAESLEPVDTEYPQDSEEPETDEPVTMPD